MTTTGTRTIRTTRGEEERKRETETNCSRRREEEKKKEKEPTNKRGGRPLGWEGGGGIRRKTK